MSCRSLPKQRRLKKPAEFSVIYQNNQIRVKGQYFVVLAFYYFTGVVNQRPSDTIAPVLMPARLGGVVSKKVSKSAVRRNRIKRLIRESFRYHRHLEGFDFIVIAKPFADQADNQRLTQELNKLWNKIHKRCDAYLLL